MRNTLVILLTALSVNAMAQDMVATPTAPKVYKNQLTVSPLAITTTNPNGFGAQYERSISNSGKWAVTLPVSYSFGNSNPCDPEIKTYMFRAAPGVKFYPAGTNHRVSYSIGANALVGKGESNCQCDDMNTAHPQTAGTGTTAESQTQIVREKTFSPMTEAGLLINNSVTVMATKRIFIGSDLGIGGRYVDYKTLNQLDIAFRFNFNIGFKF